MSPPPFHRRLPPEEMEKRDKLIMRLRSDGLTVRQISFQVGIGIGSITRVIRNERKKRR